MSRRERVALLDRDDPLSLSRQCRLLDVSRMAAYRPIERAVSQADLDLMRRMDAMHTESPAMGARQFVAQLRLDGIAAGRNRVRRLMRVMGIRHVAPPPNTSAAVPSHKVHPYLLGGLDITEPNQVWCSDITHIPVRGGFLYLVAVMDWATRFVLSWQLSNSMGVSFCLTPFTTRCRAAWRPPSPIRTKARSSPAGRSRRPCLRQGHRCRWTVAAVSWTTSSSSGCGVRSNGMRCICTNWRTDSRRCG